MVSLLVALAQTHAQAALPLQRLLTALLPQISDLSTIHLPHTPIVACTSTWRHHRMLSQGQHKA
jgi:hypothetical protein